MQYMRFLKSNFLIEIIIMIYLKKKFLKLSFYNLKKEIIFILFISIFLFEIALISHRVGFYFNNLFNFYKKEQGLENVMIKKSTLHQIHQTIIENEINNFSLDTVSLTNEINYPFENLFQRVVEISYPILFDTSSKFVISGSLKKIDQCKIINTKKNIILYGC
jgi:hypothetical protein